MRIVFLALGLLLSASAFADHTAVFGKFRRQYYIDVTPDCPQPEDKNFANLCMDSWVGFEIAITKTVAGPPAPRRIRIVRLQHGPFSDETFRTLRSKKLLLILEPISDPDTRNKLKSDYYWVDSSELEGMYCLYRDPASYGLGDKASIVYVSPDDEDPSHCFKIKE
jgi:hypothetical protein